MANQEHLDILKQGVEAWNAWREEYLDIQPDLSMADLKLADLEGVNLYTVNLYKADLSSANLMKADLFGVNLSEANLTATLFMEADLSEADLRGANLELADLSDTNLRRANLSNAKLHRATLNGAYLRIANLNGAFLQGANLIEAMLFGADLSEADLKGAHLDNAILVRTILERADLRNCTIYGISAWDIKLEGATQSDLIITDENEPIITVDNLEVAQFIYLLLHNKKIRDVIDTITSKVVLILGRFTPERKAILDAIRGELRLSNYTPVLFDFDKPASRDLTETVSILAHLARFIIADLTDPASIPQELQAIVPTLAVPVQPILLEGKREYSMFVDLLKKYDWMLPIHYYLDRDDLLIALPKYIIEPAEQKAQKLSMR